MKRFIFLLIAFSLICCKYQKQHIQTLTDKEWWNILNITLSFTKDNETLIQDEFENYELKKIISSVYTECSDLGYTISDSVLKYISNRKNIAITNKLDTMFNVRFVTYNDKDNHNIVSYSEPFYIAKDLICLSMSYSLIDKNKKKQWVFIFKKFNGIFKLIEFYDINKDTYYKTIPLANRSLLSERLGESL